MDPVTHALIGLGISALSGQPLSPYNPANCAAVVGALVPDLDVLTMLESLPLLSTGSFPPWGIHAGSLNCNNIP